MSAQQLVLIIIVVENVPVHFQYELVSDQSELALIRRELMKRACPDSTIISGPEERSKFWGPFGTSSYPADTERPPARSPTCTGPPCIRCAYRVSGVGIPDTRVIFFVYEARTGTLLRTNMIKTRWAAGYFHHTSDKGGEMHHVAIRFYHSP